MSARSSPAQYARACSRSASYENGALKVHGFSGTVEGNLLVDNPYSVGMWFDDLWWDLRVTRNVIVVGSTPQTREWLNDERIQMAGIMLEMANL